MSSKDDFTKERKSGGDKQQEQDGQPSQKEKYVCVFCGKVCGNAALLENHKYMHRAEMQHVCNCGRRFDQQLVFVDHALSCRARKVSKAAVPDDGPEKPFKCDDCGKSLKTASGLKNHKLVHHGKKPFACEKCGEGFTFKWQLTDHPLFCLWNKRDFKCDQCRRKFTTSQLLSEHKKTHSETFKCPSCVETFPTSTDLELHQAEYGEQKIFTCQHCLYQFEGIQHFELHISSCEENAAQQPQQFEDNAGLPEDLYAESTALFDRIIKREAEDAAVNYPDNGSAPKPSEEIKQEARDEQDDLYLTPLAEQVQARDIFEVVPKLELPNGEQEAYFTMPRTEADEAVEDYAQLKEEERQLEIREMVNQHNVWEPREIRQEPIDEQFDLPSTSHAQQFLARNIFEVVPKPEFPNREQNGQFPRSHNEWNEPVEDNPQQKGELLMQSQKRKADAPPDYSQKMKRLLDPSQQDTAEPVQGHLTEEVAGSNVKLEAEEGDSCLTPPAPPSHVQSLQQALQEIASRNRELEAENEHLRMENLRFQQASQSAETKELREKLKKATEECNELKKKLKSQQVV